MKQERVFYQDFLFNELPVDEHDNPIVNVLYSSSIEKKAIVISLNSLLQMDKKDEWNSFLSGLGKKDVVILDDVMLMNSELDPYKQVYLAAYFYTISKTCSSCVVCRLNKNVMR